MVMHDDQILSTEIHLIFSLYMDNKESKFLLSNFKKPKSVLITTKQTLHDVLN